MFVDCFYVGFYSKLEFQVDCRFRLKARVTWNLVFLKFLCWLLILLNIQYNNSCLLIVVDFYSKLEFHGIENDLGDFYDDVSIQCGSVDDHLEQYCC